MEADIDVNLIDIKDETYRISKKAEDGSLSDSIQNYGLLEKPFLIKKGDRYIPFTCHKRIKICTEKKIEKINAIVLSKPDAGIFFNNLVLKIFRNEVGPAGRLKSANILESISARFVNDNSLNLRKIIGVPGEYFEDKSARNGILELPAELIGYIDSKDVSFKVIKDITAMAREEQEILNSWLQHFQIRVNIFKKIVDHIFDISRREGVESLKRLSIDGLRDDSELYLEILKLRYPEYSRICKASAERLDKIKAPGLSVDFPEFLERDYITLKLNVSKKSGAGDWRKILSGISDEHIIELLDLL